MSFIITYEPRNQIPGVKPSTITKATAVEAWAPVQALEASDEKYSINSGLIGRQELHRLAEQEEQ